MLNPERYGHLAGLGDETAGAVTTAECRAYGLSNRVARDLVMTGRWQSPFRGVYVIFSGPIPLLTIHHAALLYAGDGAVLSHATAAWLWGLGRRPPDIHVTVPFSRSVAPQPGLLVHRSRNFGPDDWQPAKSPRRTRIERTVIDLLADARTGEAALGLVADAMRGRRTTPDRLREALAGQSRVRWRVEVMGALPDLRAGAHSLLEIKDARLRRTHGLPAGIRQFTRDINGVEHLDVLIAEYRLHIELDGRFGHDRAVEEWRDYRRDNNSEVLRLRHLRYGWADMIDRPCQIAAQQAEILRQQGWDGQFRWCKRCPR